MRWSRPARRNRRDIHPYITVTDREELAHGWEWESCKPAHCRVRAIGVTLVAAAAVLFGQPMYAGAVRAAPLTMDQ